MLTKGVPWNVVFNDELKWDGAMPDKWVTAFAIRFRELEGLVFDWSRLIFENAK